MLYQTRRLIESDEGRRRAYESNLKYRYPSRPSEYADGRDRPANAPAPDATQDPYWNVDPDVSPLTEKHVHTGGLVHRPDRNGSIRLPAFSGCDIVTTFYIAGNAISVYNIATLSIDSNRNLTPVPTLGNVRVRKYGRGHRMLAGTMVFYSTTEGPIPLYGVNTVYPAAHGQRRGKLGQPHLDELAPFDVIISYMDEYGRSSHEELYGVIINRISSVIAVNDVVTEIQCSYYALDRSPPNQAVRMGRYTQDENVSENVIIANNVSALEYEKRRIESIVENLAAYQDELDAETYATYTPILSTESGILGTPITVDLSTVSIAKLNREINRYNLAIANMEKRLGSNVYDPDNPYVYGDRPFDFNRE